MSRFCPFSPSIMSNVWFSMSLKHLYSGCLLFTFGTECGPLVHWIPHWFGSLCLRPRSHLMPNGSWSLFAPNMGLAAVPYASALSPFAAERAEDRIRARMCLGPLLPSVGALPDRYRMCSSLHSVPNGL